MTTSVAGRTAIGAGWMVAWRMVSRGLGLISTLILARLLVPADFGLIAMAVAFTGAVSYLSAMGVTDALIRRPDTNEEWFNTAFGFQAYRGLLNGAVIIAGTGPAVEWFSEPRLGPILYVVAATAVLAGFENVGMVEYRRSIQFDIEFRLLIIPRLLQFFGGIGMALVIADYRAMLFGSALFAVSRFIMTYRLHPWRPNLRVAFRVEHWRGLLSFSAWTWAAGLGSLVWERCDPFILGPALGTSKLGGYLLAAEIATLPVTEIVAPAMAALYAGISVARAQGTNVAAIAPTLILALLTVLAPITIGLSATSGYLVTGLLGPQWQELRPMIAVFCLTGILSPIAFTCNTLLTSQGLVRRGFLAIAGSAIARAIAMTVLVRANLTDFAPAAAVAVTAIEAAFFLTQIPLRNDPAWRSHLLGLARITIAAAITATAFLASGTAWQPVALSPILALLIGGSLGLMGIALFLACQFALWWACGSPDGAERHVFTMLRSARRRTQPA